MSNPAPAVKVCSRCHAAPARSGQRWCDACRAAWKRQARRNARSATARPQAHEQKASGERPPTPANVPHDLQPQPSVAHLWTGWRRVYLEHVVKTGGTFRALARAGVTPGELQDAIDQDRDFAEAVDRAKGEHADDLAEGLVETRFPVGRIVRLKALRPAEYIERSAQLIVATDLNQRPPIDATALLKALLGSTTESTRKMLGPDARLEDAPRPEAP